VLAKFGHIESIPASVRDWGVNVTNSATLADTLVRDRDLALLFRNLATLRSDIPLFDDVEQLRWSGPKAEFEEVGRQLDAARTETLRATMRRPGRKNGPGGARNPQNLG
jgi:hypothetical protein